MLRFALGDAHSKDLSAPPRYAGKHKHTSHMRTPRITQPRGTAAGIYLPISRVMSSQLTDGFHRQNDFRAPRVTLRYNAIVTRFRYSSLWSILVAKYQDPRPQ
jgi:hypothetical protein